MMRGPRAVDAEGAVGAFFRLESGA